MAEKSSLWSWSTDGATVRGALRPDGRLQLRLPEEHPCAWAALLELAAEDARAPLLVNRPGDDSAAAVTALDVAAVVALDNVVREDIPGTVGWQGSVADMEETLADPEFDP